jgi:hypothetical protein
MWQNMRSYQTIINNPCPHINAELLLCLEWITPWGFSSAHWCWLWIVMMLSLQKHASSVKSTEETKKRSALHATKVLSCWKTSYNPQIKCFWTHADMNIFSCFGMWKSCPKFVPTFQFRIKFNTVLSVSRVLLLNCQISYSILIQPCSVQPTWLVSTILEPRSSVGGFTSDLALG